MTETADVRPSVADRIVEQAARLLREQGPAAVTTRRVAEAAGVQAPTLYRLFGDKDGLLDAVAEHVMATYVAAKTSDVEAAQAGRVDPLEDLRSGWRHQIDFGVANPTLFALLSDPARRSPAAQAGREVLATRVHRLALDGRLRVTEDRAIDLIHAAGTGAILTILATGADPALADDLLDAVLGRILTDEPVADDRARDPAATAWPAAAIAVRARAAGLTALTEAERDLLAEWLDRIVSSTDH